MPDPLRVLVVDDAKGYRHLLGLVLEGEDRYEVVGEAADGEAALEQARELAPDLILLDLSMPGMDGFDALERLREQTLDAGVVLLSGHDADRMEGEARKHGALGYIEKGDDPEALVVQLDELLDEAGV